MVTEADRFIRAYDDPFWQSVLEKEADYLRRELSGCTKILDVGCGVGAMENRLTNLDIIGLDADRSMIDAARRAGKGNYVLGDACALCFKDAAFEAIVFITSLEFMADYAVALSEAARVTEEGGRLAVMALNTRSRNFKSQSARKDSYLKNVKVLEPERIRSCAAKYFNTEAEYFLGVEDKELFDSKDENRTALYIVKGRKTALRRE
jgi:ubiquinone/menaquinone biosynthesis C-methylase UbiE